MNSPIKLRDVVDDVLTYLEASEAANAGAPFIEGDKANARRHALPAAVFDGAVPLGMNGDEDEETAIRIDDRMDAAGKLPIWPIDSTWANWQRDADGQSMLFSRFRTIKAREARGVAKLFSPVMAERCLAVVYGNGRKLAARSVFSLIGGKWVDARGAVMDWSGNYGESGGFEHINAYEDWELEEQQRSPLFATWVALRQRYDWSVLLGYDGTARVRFFTDPIGLREVFKLRDLPPGRERRAALKHWVRSHWRRQRKDDEAQAWVRRHIRGADSFAWEGLRCAIAPAAYDLEQIRKGVA